MVERKKITYEYEGQPLGKCAKCDAIIFFTTTAKGKPMPVNHATLESHFADCPAAAQFRKGKI